MKSSKIMIIRHGEKPANSGFPVGVTHHGKKDEESLSIRGWQRAGALAVLFAPSHGELQNAFLATPDHMFAPGIGKHSNSKRSAQVISVLADKLELEIETKYLKGDEKKVAKKAMKAGGTVLIAWEHTNIHLIANKIMGCELVPQEWPGDRYDIVYVFDYDVNSDSYIFTQVPQMIISGDQPTTIPHQQEQDVPKVQIA
jgi:hypothetical protein